MTKFLERNSTKLTVSEFYDNYKQDKYNFDSSYQRKSNVWSEDKKAFLIDSILKNCPIPSIFLRPSIDENGKTKYDVIDGKQRLRAIIDFIEGTIPLTSYFADDPILTDENEQIAEKISGHFFNQIKEMKATEYIKQFWTYTLPIEYLYEDNQELVSAVFDRLNRNGEPLTPQELRNAKYGGTCILKTVKKISKNVFFKDKIERLKIERMEDEEFISELLFLILDKKPLESDPDTLDKKYEEYKSNQLALNTAVETFKSICIFLGKLQIDFDSCKRLFWTTHLYTLFSVGWYCVIHSIPAEQVSEKISEFYTHYFGTKSTMFTSYFKEYKDACSSRTRSAGQRNKRLKAVLSYCDIPNY